MCMGSVPPSTTDCQCGIKQTCLSSITGYTLSKHEGVGNNFSGDIELKAPEDPSNWYLVVTIPLFFCVSKKQKPQDKHICRK